MKKILLFTLITCCFACSKKSANNPVPATWITGKWIMVAAYNDTIANKQKIDVAAYMDQLTFTNDGNAASYGSKATFTYSLTDLTINESNVIFHIKQTSSSTFTLTHYGEAPFFEMFKKDQ